ncbi:MAG TPA: TonB-dependent receptor, partial [Pyrinomonadaceae bacterium]|nr:TonB-dependent receptor [Pyrinomonadaceae bacterium]
MQSVSISIWRVALVAAILTACSIVGIAQFRAGVQGVVTDNAGAIVPGATVTLTNKDTNQTQTTQTNDDGFYRFSALAPGNYSVSVEKPNFSRALVDDVKVDAEAIKGQDISLQAGAITETVTVAAEGVQLQTEDANIRKTITNEEVLNLPKVGRDPYELVRLTPGIVGLGARGSDGASVGLPNTSGPGGSNNSIFQTENAVPISANGQRASSNNFQIDGVSVNSQNWGGSAIVTPSQETVKEIQVLATTYSAEDGRNSGAQIKTITQNGTNDWHGSLFFKHTDPGLNAFNRMPSSINGIGVDGPRRVERKYQTYGGSIGGQLPFFNFGENDGPMFRSGRDKSWFFFAYEGLRENTNVPYYSWIETAAYRNAVLTQRAGTPSAAVIGAPGGEPRTLQILAPRLTSQNRWACGPDDSILLNNFPNALVGNGIDFGRLAGAYGTFATDTSPDGVADIQCAQLPNERSNRGQQYFGRLDFQVTERAKLAFTAMIVPFKSGGMDSSAQSRPQADLFSDRLNFAAAAIYNQTFSANILNEARFSYSGWGFDEVESNPEQNFGIPRIEVEGIWSNRLRWGVPQPGTFRDRQFNFRDTLTNILGNHVLKIGGEYALDKNAGGRINLARPLFSFVRPWNLANGTPVFESVGANTQGKPTADDTLFHTTGAALFVQDDWKIRPNLSLNFGLRWEFMGPITPDRNVISNLILGPDGGLTGARIDVQDTLTDPDWNNFAPQFGFAWSPGRFDNKLVIRGGTGLAYDRLANALLTNARRNPGAPSQLYNICCGFGVTDPAFIQMNFNLSSDGSIFGFPVHPNLPALGGPEIYGAPRDLPNASVWRYSLEAQYELGWNTVAMLGYTGARGKNFVR